MNDRIEQAESAATPQPPPAPAQTARELGYRMPAEFEPVEAVWLTYPHNRDTWPNCFDEACAQYDILIRQIARFARVEVIGRDHDLKTNDSWIRDYGPIFVVRNQPTDTRPQPPKSEIRRPQQRRAPLNPKSEIARLAAHDFTFNGWGGKYDTDDYQPALDDVVPRYVARRLNIPLWRHDLILEGGSIDVNGRGSVITTEQCLLNTNRNSKLSREQIEQALHDALGTRHIIWLPGGIEGDDTDGHIDDVARFIAPDTVAAPHPPAGHVDHDILDLNWQALRQARDQDGRTLNLIPLPAPDPSFYDYPPIGNDPGGRYPLPASYANFLIVNDGVLVPTFGQRHDDTATRTLEQAMPGRTVVGVRCDRLIVGFGAIHCLSMQQPRV